MLERDNFPLESASYGLSEHCRFVPGAKRAAIYDLETGNVYSLNELASKIVGGSVDRFGFWKKLVEMGLVESFPKAFREIEVKIPQVGLEFMWLELTGKCNERCLHCYASAGNSPQTKELSLAAWEQVIEEGAVLGCRQLQFIGGEPLLFGGIFDLAQTARDLNYSFIEIFSNGTLLNEAKIKRIKDLGIQIAISLYSIIPEVHDAVTQIPGSFQKTFRALEMLKEAQVRTRIGLIVMKQNQDTLSQTQSKLQEMGFGVSRADVVRPSGRGGCADLFPRDDIIQTYALMSKPDFFTSKEQFYRHQYWNSCWAGKIAITSDGGIMPCIFARNHVVADITNGLEKAVNSETLLKLWKLTKDQVEGCQNCEYRYACHDCRPLAEGTTGNLYAQNPRCNYNPLTGEWLEPKKEGGGK